MTKLQYSVIKLPTIHKIKLILRIMLSGHVKIISHYHFYPNTDLNPQLVSKKRNKNCRPAGPNLIKL